MNTFTLQLQDISQVKTVECVTAFNGQDASGNFGILANHERMMTSLSYGLAQFRTADGRWHYLVLPGGLLYFIDNRLTIAARRFFLDDDRDRIIGDMEAALQAEEENLRVIKKNLQHLEQEMLRRMWRMEAGKYGHREGL